MRSKYLLRVISLLVLLVSFVPADHAAASTSTAVPPADMFQLPWEQGVSWVALDAFDNGFKRLPNSPHNYQNGGAVDFAPRKDMRVGEDTSNFWVTAAAAGTVVEKSSCHLKINHGNGWITEYQFLANIQVNVGSTVYRNQRLAVIADGLSQKFCPPAAEPDIPHLHFSLRPNMRGAAFSGWTISYIPLLNKTTFSKGDQSVGSYQPLLNAPDLQVVLRDPITWDTVYIGSVDAYRYERWPFVLNEFNKFTLTATPTTSGLTPLLILLDANGNEITRGTGALTSTQSAGNYFVQVQPQAGSGYYKLLLQKNDVPPPSGPFVSTVVTPSGINAGEMALVSVSLNNVPAEGYTSAEFTCTYDANLAEVSNIVLADLFGADAATAISGPQSGKFILAIAGSKGNKATTSGLVFTFNVKGLQAGQTMIECTARVSKGDNALSDLPSIGTGLAVLGNLPTPTVTPSITPFVPTATPDGQPANSPTPTATLAGPINSPTPSVTPGGPTATVTPVASIAYDFATNACAAAWSSGAGQLPCPGTDGDANGFVLKVSNPILETGVTDTRPGLLTFPQNIQNGYIQGVFPPFRVQNGDRFRSIINCENGAVDCYVLFRLDYQIGADPINTFFSFIERYEGKYYSTDIDLSPLAGKDVKFILTVLATGPASGDRALWVGPIIYRADAGPTPVASATPTSISGVNTYQNIKYGFEFKYPLEGQIVDGSTDNYARIDLPFVQGTNLREKYLEVIVAENSSSCRSPLATQSMLETSETVIINGISFLKETGGDAGAGNLHQWIAYSTPGDNVCVSLDFILHSLNPGNFETPPPVFDYAAETAVFGQIVSTYAWLIPPITVTPTFTPTPIASPTSTPIPPLTLTGQVFAGKPVTVSLYNADSSLAVSVTANSDGTFSITAPAGAYTVVATASGYLSAQGSATLTGASASTMPTISLPAGDIDNNNVINPFDAMTIGMSYNTAVPAAADLNNDGIINVLDLELLALNYRKVGPIAWQ